MKTIRILPYLLLSLSITFLANVNCSAEDEHTPLGEEMDQIGREWRMVKRYSRDASRNARTLEHVKNIQSVIKKAKQYKPVRLEDIPEGEKDAFLEDYNKNMKEFASKIDNLVKLLEAGDNAGATALIGKIDDHRKESHEAFKRPE